MHVIDSNSQILKSKMSAIGVCASEGGTIILDDVSLNVVGKDAKAIDVDDESTVLVNKTTATVNGEPRIVKSIGTMNNEAAKMVDAAKSKDSSFLADTKTKSAINDSAVAKPAPKPVPTVGANDISIWSADGSGAVTIVDKGRVTKRVYAERTEIKLQVSKQKMFCRIIAEPKTEINFGTIQKVSDQELKANPFVVDSHRYDYETQGRTCQHCLGCGSFRVRDKDVVFLVKYYHCVGPSNSGFWVDGFELSLPH